RVATAARMHRYAQYLTSLNLLRRWGLRAAGLDPRRPVPRLADRSFRRTWPTRRATAPEATGAGTRTVMLWLDTFTDTFAPEIAEAAVRLLESTGHTVTIPGKRVCCGLTWISTGQLDGARARLRATLAALAEHVRSGGLVVGLEPSCTAALRADLPELLPDDPRSEPTARAVRTLAEFLADQPGLRPPDRSGRSVVVQPHCHQHAVLGFDADRRIIAETGAEIVEISG